MRRTATVTPGKTKGIHANRSGSRIRFNAALDLARSIARLTGVRENQRLPFICALASAMAWAGVFFPRTAD